MVYEGIFANWADVIVKTGAVLYTNVLYAEALKSFSAMCVLLDETDAAEQYGRKHLLTQKRLNEDFWNGAYYDDWITARKAYRYFSTDGNVLAMLFGISGEDRADSIVRCIENFRLDSLPMQTNYPTYPWWRVALRMRVVGMPGYQNHFASWLWLGCVYAVALHRKGDDARAERVHRAISATIERHGMVYELYRPDGMPYAGWLWKSATSFAWSAGLYLWMTSEMFGSGATVCNAAPPARRQSERESSDGMTNT